MSSYLRIINYLVFASCIVIILACGKDKTIQPPVNQAPSVPSNPSPAMDATGVGTSLTLRWHSYDSDYDTIKYDVYFDTLANPGVISSGQLDSTYALDSIEVSRDYYWKIVAIDEHDSATASPVWHFSTVPGQERIAYLFNSGGHTVIRIMNADGAGPHVILDTLDLFFSGLTFSNDGSKLVFGRVSGGIYTANHDGTGLFQVISDNWVSEPVWSPDGSQIAYVVEGDNEVFHGAVWVVDANGENPHQITRYRIPNWESEKIAWSMQGQIAFPSDSVAEYGYAIYTVNSDGTNLRQISHNTYYDSQPAWSHDGANIAFVRYVPELDTYQIFVMNSDGSNVHNVQNSQSGSNPCWSPDDSQIAYCTSDAGGTNIEIYVMNADGSNPMSITNSPFYNGNPSWAPYSR